MAPSMAPPAIAKPTANKPDQPSRPSPNAPQRTTGLSQHIARAARDPAEAFLGLTRRRLGLLLGRAGRLLRGGSVLPAEEQLLRLSPGDDARCRDS